jgi:hypothetical protein
LWSQPVAVARTHTGAKPICVPDSTVAYMLRLKSKLPPGPETDKCPAPAGGVPERRAAARRRRRRHATGRSLTGGPVTSATRTSPVTYPEVPTDPGRAPEGTKQPKKY